MLHHCVFFPPSFHLLLIFASSFVLAHKWWYTAIMWWWVRSTFIKMGWGHLCCCNSKTKSIELNCSETKKQWGKCEYRFTFTPVFFFCALSLPPGWMRWSSSSAWRTRSVSRRSTTTSCVCPATGTLPRCPWSSLGHKVFAANLLMMATLGRHSRHFLKHYFCPRCHQRCQPPSYWWLAGQKVVQWPEALHILWDLLHLRPQCGKSLSGWWEDTLAYSLIAW